MTSLWLFENAATIALPSDVGGRRSAGPQSTPTQPHDNIINMMIIDAFVLVAALTHPQRPGTPVIAPLRRRGANSAAADQLQMIGSFDLAEAAAAMRWLA